MTNLTTAQITALASEITADPSDPKVGYATYLPGGTSPGNDGAILALLNALTTTMPQPILMPKVLTFGAETGVIAKVQANVSNVTVAGGTTIGAICTSVLLMFQTADTLDITDVKILAMLDALVAAGILTNSDNSTAKPSLIALGTVPASRPMALGIVPFGTPIQLGDISMALRGY